MLAFHLSSNLAMPACSEKRPRLDFEIDHCDEYAQYILDQEQEILFYLNQLARHHELISVYIDDGQQSFLTTLLAVDEENGYLFFDPPQSADLAASIRQAHQITLIARLERVKTLFRLDTPNLLERDGSPALFAKTPALLLRLQRREFFRLELSGTAPVHCGINLGTKVSGELPHNLKVLDISAGGLSLEAPLGLANNLDSGRILKDCRLEIPDEHVLQVNLQILKVVEVSTHSGPHKLRIGCSFIDIPAIRLATIERYIARIERERTAKFSGLSD